MADRISRKRSCRVGQIVDGKPLDGVTIVAGKDYGGRTWGRTFDGSKFSEDADDDVPAFCRAICNLMPATGESKLDAGDVYAHVFSRVTELVAGTEAERLFVPGEPWRAANDLRQARYYSAMITSSTAATETFYCILPRRGDRAAHRAPSRR